MIMTPLTVLVVNCAAGFLLYLFARYMTRCETRVAIYNTEDYFLTYHKELTPEEQRLIIRYTAILIDELNGNFTEVQE